MIGLDESLYVKGLNRKLDLKFAQYKKVNLFAGRGIDEALSDKEGNTLINLWRKERMVPRKLRFRDVSTLVEFMERILDWRSRVRREKIRIRVERSRKKLLEASKNGDKEARRKVKNKKKTDALRSSKYRNLKREKTRVLVKRRPKKAREVRNKGRSNAVIKIKGKETMV